MFKLIGFFVKATVFSVAVLVMGSLIEWKGGTLSDRVRDGIEVVRDSSVIQRSGRWMQEAFSSGRDAARKLLGESPNKWRNSPTKEASDAVSNREELLTSERQKLKALIHELNSSKASTTAKN